MKPDVFSSGASAAKTWRTILRISEAAGPFPVPVVLGIAALFVFSGLGSYGLLDNNEGLYAEISREMLASHRFVTPLLNGVPYLEKPPLLYWLTSLSFLVFGQSEFAARLVPALSAIGALCSLIWLGCRVKSKSDGSLAALVLGSSIGFIGMGRIVLFDMLMTAFLSWALALLLVYLRSGKRTYLRWSFAALGLAVMAKGIVALAFYAIISLLYVLLRRGSGVSLRSLWDPISVFLFLAVVTPWHVMAAVENKDFLWFYFVNDHVLRFLGMRIPDDVRKGPWYYYLVRIAAGFFPWTPFLPLTFRPREPVERDSGLTTFLWLWLLVPLVFFSLSEAKGAYYMVVGLPPLAYLLAAALNRLPDTKCSARLLSSMAGALAVTTLVALAVFHAGVRDSDRLTLFFSDRVSIAAALVLFLAMTAAGAVLFGMRRRAWAIYSVTAAMVPVIVLALSVMVRSEQWFSSHRMAHYLNDATEQRPVFLYRDYEEISALPFYLRSPLPVIDSASSDLYYGSRHSGRGRDFVRASTFIDESRHKNVYVVVADSRLPEFRRFARRARLSVLQRIGRTTLFANDHDCHACHAVSKPTMLSDCEGQSGVRRKY